MKFSRILASATAASLVIAPIAAQANTRASASDFTFSAADLRAASAGSRSSSGVSKRHRQNGGEEIILGIVLLGGAAAAVLAGTGNGNRTRSPR